MHLAGYLEHWKRGVIKVVMNFMTLNKTWEQPPLGIKFTSFVREIKACIFLRIRLTFQPLKDIEP